MQSPVREEEGKEGCSEKGEKKKERRSFLLHTDTAFCTERALTVLKKKGGAISSIASSDSLLVWKEGEGGKEEIPT